MTVSEIGLHQKHMPQIFHRVPAAAYAPAPYLENAKVDPATGHREPARDPATGIPSAGAAFGGGGERNLRSDHGAGHRADGIRRNGTRGRRSGGPHSGGTDEVAGESVAFAASAIPQRKLEVVFGQRRPVSFSLLPDGLRTLIGWMADMALRLVLSPDQPDTPPLEKHCVVLIDEPELHLHRSGSATCCRPVPRLLPNAQIIAATHSPWVVCSVNEGWLHRLKIGAGGAVDILPPQPLTPGDSVLDVLEDVMEVPQWYDPESERMLDDLKARMASLTENDSRAVQEALTLAERIARRGEALAQIVAPDLLDLRERTGKPAAD